MSWQPVWRAQWCRLSGPVLNYLLTFNFPINQATDSDWKGPSGGAVSHSPTHSKEKVPVIDRKRGWGSVRTEASWLWHKKEKELKDIFWCILFVISGHSRSCSGAVELKRDNRWSVWCRRSPGHHAVKVSTRRHLASGAFIHFVMSALWWLFNLYFPMFISPFCPILEPVLH